MSLSGSLTAPTDNDGVEDVATTSPSAGAAAAGAGVFTRNPLAHVAVVSTPVTGSRVFACHQ